MRNKTLVGGAIALVAALAACGGGGGHAFSSLPGQSVAPVNGGRGTATISIRIPATKKPMNALKRGVKYIPSATDTMVVIASAAGVAGSPQTFSLAANSSLCVADVNGDGGRSCTVNVVAPIGSSDSFDVTLEALIGGSEVPLAHGLLSGQDIVEGQANPTMSLVLGGIVTYAYISVGTVGGVDLDPLFATENDAPGIPINVHAEDPSYQIIIGDYDTSPTSGVVTLATPDFGGYVDANGNSADGHQFLSSNDQVYYVPAAGSGTYGSDANSTGDGLLLDTVVTTGSGAGATSSIYTNEWFYTPSQITDAMVSAPTATGPFTIGASDTNAAYTTANGGIATFSGTDASLYPTQQCSTYVDTSNVILPITPTSAVNVDTSGGFQGYALAANTVYALSTPSPFASPPANATAPLCQAVPLVSNAGNLGSLRNLVYNSTANVLAVNSDTVPVVAIQLINGNSNWVPISYGTYGTQAPPSASSPDGLLSDPHAGMVYFTDSVGGGVGAADVNPADAQAYTVTDEFRQFDTTGADTGIDAPFTGLAIDGFGDVGFAANQEAFIFNEGVDPGQTYQTANSLGRTNAPVVGGAFSDVGSIEGTTFQQYWTIDSSGYLTSFGFAPNINGGNVGVTYGATSSTPIGHATAITSFPNYPLFIAVSGGIIQYPNEAIFTQNTLSAHRHPRTIPRVSAHGGAIPRRHQPMNRIRSSR